MINSEPSPLHTLAYHLTSDLIAIIAMEPDDVMRIVSVNDPWTIASGRTMDQIVNHTLSELLSPSELARVQEKYREALRSKAPVRWEDAFTTPAGTLVLETVARPIYHESLPHPCVLSVSQDITEKKVEFWKTQEAVKARDEFISIASHELKTPLTSIQLSLELLDITLRTELQERECSSPRVEKLLRTSRYQLDRLTKLVNGLLDVSRIQTGTLTHRFHRSDLIVLVRGLIENFRDQSANVGCAIEFEGPDSIMGVWDSMRVEGVIVNLLTNALKYAPGKPIRIRASIVDKKALIQVQDCGPGIDKADHQRIFRRFERAGSTSSNPMGGLGLGLYIAHEIVKAHSGKIWVDSSIGKGSTFNILLPLEPVA